MSIRRALCGFLAVERPVEIRDGVPLEPNQVDDAWKVLDLVNGWVTHAEAKLGVTLAYLGALFAGLIAMVASFKVPSGLILLLTVVAAVLLLLGVVCAASGLLPQFKKSPDGRSAIYYRDIAALSSPKKYDERFRISASGKALLPQLTNQIFWISRVAVRKYQWLTASIILGVASLIATGVVGFGLLMGW